MRVAFGEKKNPEKQIPGLSNVKFKDLFNEFTNF